MVERARARVLVDNGEGRAGDDAVDCQSACEALDKSGLAAPEVAVQGDHEAALHGVHQ